MKKKKKFLLNSDDPLPSCVSCEYAIWTKDKKPKIICTHTNKENQNGTLACHHYSYDLTKRSPLHIRVNGVLTDEDRFDDVKIEE